MFRNPYRVGIAPHVDILGLHAYLVRRGIDGFLDLLPDIGRLDRHAQIRIALDPDLFVLPVVALVQRVDEREERIVRFQAAQYLRAHRAVLVAWSEFVEARGGDDDTQRIVAHALRGLQDVLQLGRLGCVVLVQKIHRRIESVELAVVCGQNPQGTQRLVEVHPVAVGRQVFRFRVDALDEVGAHSETDLRLVLAVGRKVHFGIHFARGDQTVKAQCGGEGGFSLLARHFHVNGFYQTAPVLPDIESVDAGYGELLPRFERERFPGVPARVVPQYPDKADDILDFLFPELVSVVFDKSKESFAGKFYPLARNDGSIQYLLRVSVISGGFSHDSSSPAYIRRAACRPSFRPGHAP